MNLAEARNIVHRIKRINDKVLIRKLFDRLFYAHSCKTHMIPQGQEFFRLVNASQLGTSIKDFSYPPEDYRYRGRCNDKGVPVFYGANSIAACLNEQKGMSKGDQFRIGVWKLKARMHTRDYTSSSIVNNAIERSIDCLLKDIFINEGELYYSHSIVLTEIMYDMQIMNDTQGVGAVNAIKYPSTIPTTKDHPLINLAINSSFVDENLELVRCYHGEIVGSDEKSYQIKTTHSCKEIDNGTIKWVKNGTYTVSNETLIMDQTETGLLAYDENGRLKEPLIKTATIQR